LGFYGKTDFLPRFVAFLLKPFVLIAKNEVQVVFLSEKTGVRVGKVKTRARSPFFRKTNFKYIIG
jgi:hypothetical protein